MTPFLRKFLGLNWLLFLLMLALAVFGVIAIHSATYTRDDSFWHRQANWVAIGVVVFFVVSLIDYRWVKWGALPAYVISMMFLVLVLIIGRKVYGARSWIYFGPFNFQPAQLAIIAGIMALAVLLSQFRNLHPMWRLILCAAVAGAPMILIHKQRALGEVIMWGPVLVALLFIGGLPLRYLISLLLIGVGFIPLVANFGLKPYQRARITAFLDPEIDPQGAAWGINQSLIAIGSGGWGGKGFKAHNTQIELGFLPLNAIHNDYIFAAVGEQWGFIGGVALLCAFALLLLICLFIAMRSADQLGLLLTVGVTALIFGHVFQNVGMTIGMLPITGVPLPLVSYSGSFVVMVMFALGLVNSVWVHRKHLPHF